MTIPYLPALLLLLALDSQTAAESDVAVDNYDSENWKRRETPGENFNIYNMKSKEFAERLKEQPGGWGMLKMLMEARCRNTYPILRTRRVTGNWVKESLMKPNNADVQCIDEHIAPMLDTMFEPDSSLHDLAPLDPWYRFHKQWTGAPKGNLASRTYPALDGMTFRDSADVIYDPGNENAVEEPRKGFPNRVKQLPKLTFNHEGFSNRSTVYWPLPAGTAEESLTKLRDFLRVIAAKKLYIFLLSHCHDNVGWPQDVVDHPNVLRVFAANHHYLTKSVGQGGKGVPLPLGLGHDDLHKHDVVLNALIIEKEQREAGAGQKRDKDILAGYMTAGGEDDLVKGRQSRRGNARRALEKNGFDTALWGPIKRTAYFEALGQYKTVVVPFGAGYDSLRTYESWMFGAVPIMDRKLHVDLTAQLPAIIHDYTELTPEKVMEKYRQLDTGKKYNRKRLWMDWWLTYMLYVIVNTP